MIKVKVLDSTGGTAAVVCPVCEGVFCVSSSRHRAGRACPHCGKQAVIYHPGHNSARTVSRLTDFPIPADHEKGRTQ